MKNIFRKAVAAFLAVTFLNVPVIAEETRALYIAPFVSSEQLSYTCKNLIDDFESDTIGWTVKDGQAKFTTDSACGMTALALEYEENVSLSIAFDDINASSAGSVCAAFKANTENGVKITVSAEAGSSVYEAEGVIGSDDWCTVSLDIRDFSRRDKLDGVTISAVGGGFLLDYVHVSSVYAPVGYAENLTEEYTFSGSSCEVSDGSIALGFDGKDGVLQSGRIDRLLRQGENAISITLDNRAGVSKLTVNYADTFGTYKSRNSYTCEVSDGVGTYIIPLGDLERLAEFKISFSSDPDGDVTVYNISLTQYKSCDTSGKCYTDGENITVSFKGKVPDGCPVYLYRMLFAQNEAEQPYLSELTEENTFVFPVNDGDKNNLLYKYSVAYEQDGELEFLCRDVTVENPEECAGASSFVEPFFKKGAYGEFCPEAGTVFLNVDVYAFISDSETKYSYKAGGKTVYVHTDSAEYLDRRVAGISAVGGAVYVCVPTVSSSAEFKNEEFVYKYSALIGYIASRYNGGEYGTVNGFVIGDGLGFDADKADSAETLKCTLDTVYLSAKSENSSSAVILSLDGKHKEGLYGFASSVFDMCPYISDVMVFCGDVQKCLDKNSFDMRYIVSSLEARALREIGLFVYAEGYTEPYGELVRDFYSLYENTSFKCLAVKHSEAVKSGNVFRYMDTAHADQYVKALCGQFGLSSWGELCDVSEFSETVRENVTGYLSYGTVMSEKNRIFTNTEGGKWLCGVGCITLSTDEKYVMASLDNSAGCGYMVFEPDEPVTVNKRTLGVKLKVDYLGADEKTAEVFVGVADGEKIAFCVVNVQSGADTTVSFDCGSIRRAKKIIIGTVGEGTPRLCVSEGFVSSDSDAETNSEENSEFVTQNISDISGSEEKNTVFLLTAVLVIVGIFTITGVILWFLGRKKAEKR